MNYKYAVVIFLAGVACAMLGMLLINEVLKHPISNDTIDEEIAQSPTEVEDNESGNQFVTVQLRAQPTPTRTELLANQLARRSHKGTASTQDWYEKMLPRTATLCTDTRGMSDVVNMLVFTHERIIDLGFDRPEDLWDVSYNLNSIFVEMAPKTPGDMPCRKVAELYVELRTQGHSSTGATSKILGVIREQ